MRPTLTVSQISSVLRAGARDIGPPGFDTRAASGSLNIPASLAAPRPDPDPGEPNDDVDQVKPGQLFALGEPPLTTTAKPSTRIAATLDAAEDPRDLYRVWVPAHRTRARDGASAAAARRPRIWGAADASSS